MVASCFLDDDVIKNYRRRAVAALATALPFSLFFKAQAKDLLYVLGIGLFHFIKESCVDVTLFASSMTNLIVLLPLEFKLLNTTMRHFASHPFTILGLCIIAARRFHSHLLGRHPTWGTSRVGRHPTWGTSNLIIP